MGLRELYDGVMELEKQLQEELLERAQQELLWEPVLRSAPDYKSVQALSACFTLQEYLSNAIAQAVVKGELPPEEEGDDWPS